MTTRRSCCSPQALLWVALVSLCLGTPNADGATTEWTEDGSNGNFSNPDNWTDGVPTSGDTTRFSPDKGPATQTVIVDTNATTGELVLTNHKVTVASLVSVTDLDLTMEGRAGSSLNPSRISINPLSATSAAGVGNIYVTLTNMDITTGSLALNEPFLHEGETIFRMDASSLHIEGNTFGETAGYMTISLDNGSVLSSGNFSELRVGSVRLTRDSVIDYRLDMWSGSQIAVGEGSGRLQKSSTIDGDVLAQSSSSRVVFGDPTGAVPGLTTVSGVISGPGGVVVDGPNHTLRLLGANTFTGGLRLEQGVATASSGSRLGGLDSFLQFSGGTLQATGSFTIGIESFINGESGIDTNGNSVAVTGDFTGSADGVFTKSGAGTLTLNNNGGDYPGDFLVVSGTLVSGDGNSFSTSSTVAINAGATLRFDGAEYFDGLNGDGEVEVNGQTLRLGDNDTTTNDFAGQLVGGGTIIKDGTGSQRFSGDNSGFTGDFNLVDGSLIFASGESLSRDLVVPSGAKVEFDPESGESDYAHALSGPGVFEKDGAGALNVTGDSPDYSGYFFVGEGTVNIDGEISASEVAVVEGATVGGNGTINTLLYAEPASTISPGRSVGKLTASEFRMDSGAVLAIEIASAGDDHDQLRVTGDAQIDDATLSVGLIDGFTPAHGDEFHLLDIAGAITGTGFTQFDLPEVPGMAWDTSGVLPEGLLAIEVSLPGDYNLDGAVDAADYTVWRDNVDAPAGTLASDIDGGVIGTAQYHTWRDNFGASLANALTPAAVPEPSAAAALMVLTASLPLRRRRQKLACPAA